MPAATPAMLVTLPLGPPGLLALLRLRLLRRARLALLMLALLLIALLLVGPTFAPIASFTALLLPVAPLLETALLLTLAALAFAALAVATTLLTSGLVSALLIAAWLALALCRLRRRGRCGLLLRPLRLRRQE